VNCDDVSVAYMLSISSKVRRRGARKARPVNPQSQRLWDVLQLGERGAAAAERLEPSYSANLAPLVARARTLQRRLNALSPRLELKETQIAGALEAVRHSLQLPAQIRVSYRSFEDGLERRREIMDRLVAAGWLDEDDDDLIDAVPQSVETFHAFLAAWVGALHSVGLTVPVPDGYVAGEGWVYLPDMTARVEVEPRYFE
jgi:hypothetical protein